tara:strand:- start:40 stop:408 length:369 start_codon:yes stop_codon:yes gene_type:complete
MKKYLYFTNPGNSGDRDLIMIPADHVLGVSLPSSTNQLDNLTVTSIDYRPHTGAIKPGTSIDAEEDFVNVIHAVGDRQRVVKSLVSLINSDKTNSPFIVAADDQNGEYAIDGVTSIRSINHD